MSEKCDEIRCPALPTSVVLEAVLLGLPFLITVVLSFRVLRHASFKFRRVRQYVFTLDWFGAGYASKEDALYLAIKLLVAFPFVYVIVWTVVTAMLVDEYYASQKFPFLIAFSIALLCYMVLAGGYGWAHWYYERFRLTSVPRVTFSLVVVLVVAVQLAYIFVVVETYASTYIVFMMWNLVPMLWNSYLNKYIRSGVDFSTFLSLKSNDKETERIAAAEQARVKRQMVYNYMVSLLLLLAFALVAEFHLDNRNGFQILVSVTATDIALGFVWYSGLTSSAGWLNLLAIVARIDLIMFGVDKWFLGNCLNYAIFGLLLLYHALSQKYPAANKELALDKVVGGLQSQLERSMYRKDTHVAQQGSSQNTGLLSFFVQTPGQAILQAIEGKVKSPTKAFAIITFLFASYTGLAYYAHVADEHLESRSFPPIAITGDPHPQYQYGLFSLLLTWGVGMTIYAFQVYQHYNYDLHNKRVWIAVFLFLLLTMLSSFGLSVITDSSFMEVLGLYLPPLLCSATVTFITWRAKDYRWNSYLWEMRQDWETRMHQQKQQEVKQLAADELLARGRTRTKGASVAMAANAGPIVADGTDIALDQLFLKSVGQLEDVPAVVWNSFVMHVRALRAFFLCLHARSDYLIVMEAGTTALLVFFAGFTMTFKEVDYVGWLLADVLGMILLTAFFLCKWYFTFEIGWLLAFGMGLVLLHMGFYLEIAGVHPLVISASYVLFPAFLCFVMAVLSWAANNWHIARREKRWLLAALVLVLFCLVQFAVQIRSILIGVLLVVVWVLGSFFVFVVVRWATKGFYLERKFLISFLVLAVMVDILILVSVVVRGLAWYWAFTTVYVFVVFLLLARVVRSIFGSGSRRLFPSKWLFPVYKYDSASQHSGSGLVESSVGYALLLGVCLLAVIWGVGGAVLLSPPSIGWFVTSVGLLGFWSTVLHLTYVPQRKFWEAWSVIQKNPVSIDEARRGAIYSELKTDDDAFAQNEQMFDAVVGNTDEQEEENKNAEEYLKAIRLYWEWEQGADLRNLVRKRNKLLTQISIAEKRGDAGREELMRGLHELEEHDQLIRQTYEEQNRMTIRFMVNVIIAAEATRAKDRTLLKDFVRHAGEYDETLRGLAEWPLAKLERFVRHRENLVLLANAKSQYLQDLMNRQRLRKELQEEEMRIAQRRKERARRKSRRAIIAEEKVDEPFSRDRQVSFDTQELMVQGLHPDEVRAKALERARSVLEQRERELKALKDAGQEVNELRYFSDAAFLLTRADIEELIDDANATRDDAFRQSLVGRDLVQCKRLQELVPAGTEPKLFDPHPDPEDIIQGDLEDCYLLSAVSVLASVPERVKRLFVVDEVNHYGLYGMQFYRDGKWQTVFVDDQFPTKSNKLAFARCKGDRSFWVPILEKCYAKFYNGYSNIIGGLVHESLVDLTGGASEEIVMDQKQTHERLWNRLLLYKQEGYLMGCGNPKGSSRRTELRRGIVQGHAYAVLDLRQVDGYRLLQLRNPWGDTEWEGDWSDRSPLWTQRLKKILKHKVADDGIFWMSFEDFRLEFQKIYLCRLFDVIKDIDENSEEKVMHGSGLGSANVQTWYRRIIEAEWKGPTAAGRPIKSNPDCKTENNPQWQLVVQQPSLVFITLTQPTKTDKSEYARIQLYIVDKGDDLVRVKTIQKKDLVSPFRNYQPKRQVSVEVQLQPGKKYIVFCSTFEAGTETPFKLTTYCRNEFALKLIPNTAPAR